MNQSLNSTMPQWLVKLENALYNGLPNNEARDFRIKFLTLQSAGMNFDEIKGKFLNELNDYNNAYKGDLTAAHEAITSMITLSQANDALDTLVAKSTRLAVWINDHAQWEQEFEKITNILIKLLN